MILSISQEATEETEVERAWLFSLRFLLFNMYPC
jgi:hypothetical protein